MNTQLYHRCDAAVIDDNTSNCNKRILNTTTTATATPTTAVTVVASNGPEKKHDRRFKKNIADKCRTKTGMYCFVFCYYLLMYTSLNTQMDFHACV